MLIGCIGEDAGGNSILTGLRRSGVITSGVSRSEEKSTGAAVIAYDSTGENHIIVYPGANLDAKQDQVPDEILKEGNVLLMQMETIPEENWELIKRAKDAGMITILNLAPVAPVPDEALNNLDYLIINEIEAKQVSESLNIDHKNNMQGFAQSIAEKWSLTCIVTLGKLGSIAVTQEKELIVVPTLQVEKVIDRTGAGDCYCGTLAASLHNGKQIDEAMKYASIAGALSCRTEGTQSSYAYMGEIEENLESLAQIHKEQL